ncbi:hypothetical protein PybrP1_011003 [[Pythium] brassicae (nom. inval.)]|nr:hypothetical protein PybrP1_011003 [[Pythium] brassicae (nom. inval.)]
MVAWIAAEVVGRNISSIAVTPSPSPPRSSPPPRSPKPPTPLCDQAQLIRVATSISRLELKKQCEAVIGEPEMLKTGDPKAVCGVSSCVDALQHLSQTLPKCRFRDWDVQLHTEMLLRNCGIKPQDATHSLDGSDCSYDSEDGSAGGASQSGSFGGSGRNDSNANSSRQLVIAAGDHPSYSQIDDNIDI